MATKSRIVERSFRLGAGRYIQEEGAILSLGEEVKRLNCRKPFVVGSKTALSVTRARIEKSLAEAELTAEVYEYNEFCNPDRGAEIAESAAFAACDCVVGVGGGNIMDVAKLMAALAGKPVINIPTSSATCAAFTPLSVMYNGRGQTVGTRHHLQEVNCILADMDILCQQPPRLLVAGVYDALAKLVETRQRLIGKTEDETDIGLRSSFVLSEFMYDRLLQLLPRAFADVQNKCNSKAVYDIVYLTIALTGVISGLARGSNQCAIAHKIYENTRTLFPEISHDSLHGELVGIGLLAQLVYNGDADKEPAFRAQMKACGMPTTLTEIGIPATAETKEAYFNSLVASSAMAGCNEAEKERLKEALAVLF